MSETQTFREAVEAVRVALADATRNSPLPWRSDRKKGHIIDERGFVVWPGDSNAHTVAILNALPTILDLADEALAHRDAQGAIGDWLASDKPVHDIILGLAEIGQEQAEAEARKKAEMDAIFADCGPAKDALAYLREGLTPERKAAIDAEAAHLKAAPDFDELERLLEVAAKYAPLPWRMIGPGCMADANEAAIRQDCDALIVAAVNALPWLMREVEGGE